MSNTTETEPPDLTDPLPVTDRAYLDALRARVCSDKPITLSRYAMLEILALAERGLPSLCCSGCGRPTPGSADSDVNPFRCRVCGRLFPEVPHAPPG